MARTGRTYCKKCNGLGWVYSTARHESNKTEKCTDCGGGGIQPNTNYFETYNNGRERLA